jgi:hypothetical protein
MRAEGETWNAISAALGATLYATIERGRKIGAPRPPLGQAQGPAFRDDPHRGALPPGHPRSWEPLTRGTVLAGSGYPLPVFL